MSDGLVVAGLQVVAGDFVLGPVDLTVKSGEYLVLVGHTGAGKSLLVRALCGLSAPVAGTARLRDDDLLALPTHRRGIGYVPQHGALFPHLDVAANIGFALDTHGLTPARTRAAVAAQVERLAIGHLVERQVDSLSGGERQLVALARALARSPRLLLLDEPLSALDEAARHRLYPLLEALRDEAAMSTIHICHDRLEAARLGQRVAVLAGGQLVACDLPERALAHAETPFLAAGSAS